MAGFFLYLMIKIDELNEIGCFNFASLAVNIAYSAETNPSIQNYWSIAEQKIRPRHYMAKAYVCQ